MILNIKKESKYYILEKEPIQKEFRCQVAYISSEKPVLSNQTFCPERYVVFFGESLPVFPKLLEDETVAEATDRDLIEAGLATLEEDEVLLGDRSISIYAIEGREKYVKPVFDESLLLWVEGATEDELEAHRAELSEQFYSHELGLASKAIAEYEFDIISETTLAEVMEYIRSINPYSNTKILIKAKRPDILNKYK